MTQSNIPTQLLEDCHYLGRLHGSAVLLNRNAAVPWFILVPQTQMSDILDLPDKQREEILADCAAVSRFIKQQLGFDKVNFAGLGNVVSAMHLHIIGRHTKDPCWPQPVWGNLSGGQFYAPKQLHEWQLGLAKIMGFSAVAL
jgi:diadenosine tetraphosphate (Ap4A) HIT family hydrolase